MEHPLRSRGSDRAENLLWWDGEQLLGFLGRYTFGEPVELAGMVAPSARRRGIGAALLRTALALCHEQDTREALLVIPAAPRRGGRWPCVTAASSSITSIGFAPVTTEDYYALPTS